MRTCVVLTSTPAAIRAVAAIERRDEDELAAVGSAERPCRHRLGEERRCQGSSHIQRRRPQRCAHRQLGVAAVSLTSDPDLGPRQRDVRPPRAHRLDGSAGLLLRTPLPLAARHEREHQRDTPPVLPLERGPRRGHRAPAQRGRSRAEWSASKDPPVGHSSPPPRPARSLDRLRPPAYASAELPRQACLDHDQVLTLCRTGTTLSVASPVERQADCEAHRWLAAGLFRNEPISK
jgi:hypothetical protein